MKLREVTALAVILTSSVAWADEPAPVNAAAPTNDALTAPAAPPAEPFSAAKMFTICAGMWAFMSYLEQHDADEYTVGPLVDAFYWMGAVGTAGATVMQGAELFSDDPEFGEPKGEFGAAAYLLSYKKTSALTGELKRNPKGTGLGWDFDAAYVHPTYGVIAGGALIYQQSNVDSNDWVKIATTFTKLDAFVGLDVARLVGGLTGIEYIKRQRIRAHVGPSFFWNAVVMADEGSYNTVRNATLYESSPLVSGIGYEMKAEALLDFGFLGGIAASFQRGVYPSLSFPEVDGNQAAFITLVGFDDLRKSKKYSWQKISAEWALPFIGYWGSSVLLGAQLTRYENEKGTGVDNRGFSLGMRGQF